MPPLTQDKLVEVIQGLNNEIENLSQYKATSKIGKDYADELNEAFGKYGIIKQFRAKTSIKTVRRKLEAFKSDYEVQQSAHKIRGLETTSQAEEKYKAKKTESI